MKVQEIACRLWSMPRYALAAASLLWFAVTGAPAQTVIVDPNGQISMPIRSLTGSQPLLPDVSDYIQDLEAAQQLGKAFFWDTQAGSDGTACASCHFHAGADIRVINQVNPGLKNGDPKFNTRASGGAKGPNQAFNEHDFPFHKLADGTDREAPVTFDSNDVFSSQGTFGGDYVSASRGHSRRSEPQIASASSSAHDHRRSHHPGGRPGLGSNEVCNLTYKPLDPKDSTKGSPFHSGGLIYRKVEPRNTPTSINAVFNLRQFWDGRANNQFNGIDPFGRRTYMQEIVDPIDPNFKLGNPNADTTGIIVVLGSSAFSSTIRLDLRQPLIENASLASQAVGPPLSDFEMSCAGKTFKDLGRKLIPLKALATQAVDPLDSLFSKAPALMNPQGVAGLNTRYGQLIKKAFKQKYWSAPGRYIIDPATKRPIVKYTGGYTQMEHNFSLFWGLAIQAYEQLLIANDTPFDRYKDGDTTAMSAAAVRGMDLFNTKGNCFECHSGPLLSAAAVTNDFFLSPAPVEGMLMRDGNRAMYDGGFYNIGVRPTLEDIGNGALDPYGFDLSYTRQYRWQFLPDGAASSVDLFDVNRCTFEGQHLLTGCLMVPDPQRDAVDGSFKTPILRNVALTPPYFHNGGTSNLKEVIRFYNRGGDRRAKATGGDSTGHSVPTPLEEINHTNLAPGIGEPIGSNRVGLGLTEVEMNDLLEFLLALTDDRVACHSDVFDHPELPIPVGQLAIAASSKRSTPTALVPAAPIARDRIVTLPATGRLGLKAVTGECFPASGDLFGSVNSADTRGLQATFNRIAARVEPPVVVPLVVPVPGSDPTPVPTGTSTPVTPAGITGGLGSSGGGTAASGQASGTDQTGAGQARDTGLSSGGLSLRGRALAADDATLRPAAKTASTHSRTSQPPDPLLWVNGFAACELLADAAPLELIFGGHQQGGAPGVTADVDPRSPRDQLLKTGTDVRVD